MKSLARRCWSAAAEAASSRATNREGEAPAEPPALPHSSAGASPSRQLAERVVHNGADHSPLQSPAGGTKWLAGHPCGGCLFFFAAQRKSTEKEHERPDPDDQGR